jgi:hypothetical protein
MLDDMMTDRVTLVKADGRRFADIPCAVTRDTITIDDATLPLEEGDRLQRTLPNGLLESYEVLDRGFYTGMYDIPDHYQAKVRKESSPPRQPTVTYNVSGHNSRVNINSIDQSHNSVTITEQNVFSQLDAAIESLTAPAATKTALKEGAKGLELAKGKKSFGAKYRDFMALASDHIGVLGPMLAFLAKFIL